MKFWKLKFSLYNEINCNFIELWTLKLNDEMLGLFEFWLSHFNVQSSIKWEKIVRKVSIGCCKWETLIFKSAMDLIINKSIQCFYMYVNFYNFLKEKEHFPTCHKVLYLFTNCLIFFFFFFFWRSLKYWQFFI